MFPPEQTPANSESAQQAAIAGYLQKLVEQYRAGSPALAAVYVPPKAIGLAAINPDFAAGSEKYRITWRGDLTERIISWLDNPRQNRLALLGEYGLGKSWFGVYLAAKLAEAYLAEPDKHRLP